MWKEIHKNQYPSTLLTDSSVTEIQVKGKNISATFSQYGFFVKNRADGKYYRTDGGQLVFNGCDIDAIEIKKIRTQCSAPNLYFETMQDIELGRFMKRINGGIWKFEITEEFYAVGKGFYIGRIHSSTDSFWCSIKVPFKELVYCWNNIVSDWSY